jgi:glycosyltransferase involved in cell wall biosynthesis
MNFLEGYNNSILANALFSIQINGKTFDVALMDYITESNLNSEDKVHLYEEISGVASIVIDAFASGVPVVASNWKYNSEIINRNVGFVYSVNEPEKLVAILKDSAVNPNMLLDKKKSCLVEAEKYKINKVTTALLDNLG